MRVGGRYGSGNLNYVDFSPDFSRIVVGTSGGCDVYDASSAARVCGIANVNATGTGANTGIGSVSACGVVPLPPATSTTSASTSIGGYLGNINATLQMSTMVAVVGFGDQVDLSPRAVTFFDCESPTPKVGDVVFPTVIYGLKINVKRIVVILEMCIHIHDSNMQILGSLETDRNTKGVCALSYLSASGINTGGFVAYATPNVGDVGIFNADTLQHVVTGKAHNGPIAALGLNPCGTLLATASHKGTIIRIFRLPDMLKLASFRRGSSIATIGSIAFSSDSSRLAVSSDTGTIHLFKVPDPNAPPQPAAPHWAISYIIPSDWWDPRSEQVAKIPGGAGIPCVCGICDGGTSLVVVTGNGSLYKYQMPTGTAELPIMLKSSVSS
ncbi:autophagy protein 18 [Pelomyxa schiedti]|nr:autophagy protein 18 [Pelomyxa schiedti]